MWTPYGGEVAGASHTVPYRGRRVACAPRGGILRREEDGCNLFIKDDGIDYAGIWRAFRAGNLRCHEILRDIERRKAYRVRAGGRFYLIKIDAERPRAIESILWRFLHGPIHSKRMKAVNKAVRKGCRRTQEIFFVAEKKGRICRKTFIITEYLPGRTLETEADYTPYLEDLGAALAELHSHNLSLSDINTGNFLITDEGIRVIDLSTKGTAWAGIGRDVIEAKQLLGVDVPVRSVSVRLSIRYVRAKRAVRDRLRAVRRALAGNA